MRLLEWPRPDIHVFEVVVLALVCEGAGFRPCLNDEFGGFLVSLERMHGVGAEGEIFRADATHHARDEATAGNDVDHRVLLGEGQRVVAQAEGVAEDRDAAIDAARQGRGRDHG